MLNIEWNKYIKCGKFTSKNKIELMFKWEFDRLESEKEDKQIVLTYVLTAILNHNLVVIDTVHPKELENYADAIYYPDTKILEFKTKKPGLGEYMIYDDVITTGMTIFELIDKIGKKPEVCLCLIDRRKEAQSYLSETLHGWNLNVSSLYDVITKTL